MISAITEYMYCKYDISEYYNAGHHRPANETPFKWRFAGGSIVIIACLLAWISHRVGGNRKRSKQSTNADQKSLETVFSIAICRQSGDKWQSKTLFLTILVYVCR